MGTLPISYLYDPIVSFSSCLALVALMVASASAADSQGWTKVGNRFLKYFAPATFKDAITICSQNGGVLVEDDHPAITSYLKHSKTLQWIGATDAGHEGKWTWTRGGSVGKGKWYPREPNNCCGGQNCAVTNFAAPGSGRWD